MNYETDIFILRAASTLLFCDPDFFRMGFLPNG